MRVERVSFIELRSSDKLASLNNRIVGPQTLLGNGLNDERTIGRILDVSPRVLWSLEAFVAAVGLVLVARAWPEEGKRTVFLWLALMVLMGWATTLTLGPLLGLPI